ncbi:MAG: flagellum-specific ATP synthase FliI, partial [Alphaproteobacteria bacterium]|nr:flagellum-specific ATP synthase FliI [Alphaproteobacteria bacterium]
MDTYLKNLIDDIDALPEYRCYGSVCAVKGMLVEISGIRADLSVGDRCCIGARGDKKVVCEVVGFNNDKGLAMPFMNLDGVGPGNPVDVSNSRPVLFPDVSWLGRVINAMGEPVDGKGPLIKGKVPCLIHNSPPPAHSRERVAGKADLGVRAINTFLTVCKGQRMGIFAGSGVGKSSLMAMMARHTQLDVTVLGLI